MEESRIQFIKEAHAAACGTWKRKIEQEFKEIFEPLVPKLNQWVWVTNSYEMRTLICYQGRGNTHIGFNFSNIWTNGFGNDSINRGMWEPATNEEVREMLIIEAIKRGLDGVFEYTCPVSLKHFLSGELRGSQKQWQYYPCEDSPGRFSRQGEGYFFYQGEWIKPSFEKEISMEEALSILEKKKGLKVKIVD